MQPRGVAPGCSLLTAGVNGQPAEPARLQDKGRTVSKSWFCPYTTLVLEIELRLPGLAPNASLAELTHSLSGVFSMLCCYVI